jgi:UDP-glucuronate decarboxylase
MKILLTGGAGFIGSHLTEYLLKKTNHQIIIIDNLFSGRKSNIKSFLSLHSNRISFIEEDICNHIFPIDFYVDQIYHLACPASPPFYQKNPIHTIKTCIHGSLNVLELAKKCKCPILLSSTSEIYGEPTISPQVEEYRGNVNTIGPRSCYDEGKRLAETLFIEYKNLYDVNIKIVRIFNTYGPNLNPDDGRVVSNFIKQSLLNQNITIYGDGSQSRSFCYISDMLIGLVTMMNSNETGPINIGNPNEISIKKLAEIIINITNSNSKLVFKDLPIDDPTHRCPNITKANNKLNWYPTVSLEFGLREMINSYKSFI